MRKWLVDPAHPLVMQRQRYESTIALESVILQNGLNGLQLAALKWDEK
jgi:hypothetical protein